jgi:predicted O-methyltransferase YrrM
MVKLEELEQYALENHVPISRFDAVNFLKDLVIKSNYQSILEIGTAIAYTTINLALLSPSIQIVTIEKDEEMYSVAKMNIEDFNLTNQIEIIHDDALKVNLNSSFDLIYIDASKSKNIEFVEKFSPLLTKNGLIVVDNMLLLDVIKNAKPKKAEKYLAKIAKFKEYLENNPNLSVEYRDDIGDGYALIKVK